jgi:hypothetical protein
MVKRHSADPHRGSGTVLEYYDSMMQWHGVKLESAKRSYFHFCCRQFGSASKITILDACEYNQPFPLGAVIVDALSGK